MKKEERKIPERFTDPGIITVVSRAGEKKDENKDGEKKDIEDKSIKKGDYTQWL
jgi:hypothetical protein